MRAWPYSAFSMGLGLEFSPSWFLSLFNKGTELDDSTFFYSLSIIVTSSESETEFLNPYRKQRWHRRDMSQQLISVPSCLSSSPSR